MVLIKGQSGPIGLQFQYPRELPKEVQLVLPLPRIFVRGVHRGRKAAAALRLPCPYMFRAQRDERLALWGEIAEALP